jgi:metal-sulfur cluster biosynthetic enzyme
MATEEQIRESLEKVMVPVVMRDLNGLNLVKQITDSGKEVKITLASTALSDEAKKWVTTKAKEVVGKLKGVKKVKIEFAEAKPTELNQISNIVAVMSGKGGVGKSLVASLAAIALKRQGYEVGILDADQPPQRQRKRHPARALAFGHRDNVHQPAPSPGRRRRHLAGTFDQQHHQAVLGDRPLGQARLPAH